MIGNQKGLTRAEDISAQNVPLIAGPDDTVVGFDELGGTVYKSKTGEEYTLYPETKTPQERPIVTAAKAVGEYLSDPSLPSLEETSEFVKETAKSAYEPFRKIASGDSPTYGDLSEVLPVSMTGAATRIGKPLDDTILSSGGAGPTGYKPKMFSSGEVAVRPGTYSVAEFYSPTVETLRNTEFPSKGYKGSELLKLLRDKTPGVRKAELDSINLGINDMKRYTKEEILKLAEKNSYKVTAEVVDNDINSLIQRQVLDNPSLEDTTIKINAIPNSSENPSFLPSHGFTHYDPETIAHTRMSLRQDKDGNEYMLIEELQSDLLQKKAVNPRGEITLDEAYKELTDIRSKEILENEVVGPVYQEYKGYFDGLFKVSAEQSRIQKIKESGLGVPKEDLEKLDTLIEEVKVLGDEVYKGGAKKGVPELSAMMQQDGYDAGFLIERRKNPVGKAPVDDDADTVRIALQAAMAKAQDSYATSLVIPNLERIVTSGRARPGTLSYDRFMKPGSGFQKTYVSGVNKFVKQLVAEYGDRVRVESIELPYSLKKVGGKEVPNTAIKIDFSGIKDVDFRVGRFAEGGMVEDDQMNRLMQEGGMADDGMSREPVTGNEIPPGSLASEVRDDIDVKLSEGEYVIPADVLRYYGVRFFEDLRAQAKQGMMEMEADGRIGGTPVNAQGVPMEGQEEELTPEEEQMLMEALGGSRTAPTGMAIGGMIEQPISTPYQDQATLYQMPAGMGGPMGMQEGGLTRDSTFTFDRTQFTIPESSGAFESRKYINPTTGEEKTIQFLDGLPMGLVPEGFVPWTPALAEQSQSGTQAPIIQTPSVKPVEVERGGRDMDQTPTTGEGSVGMGYQGWAEKNSDAIKSDPFAFGMNALKGAENTMGFFGKTPIGGLISDVNKLSALSDAQFALSQPMSKEQKNTLEAAIKSMENSLSTPVATIAVKTDLAAQGTQKKNAWEAYTSRATDTAPSTGLAGKPSGTTSDPQRNIPGDTDPSGGVTRSGGRDQQGTSGTGSTGTSGGTLGGANTGNNPGNPNAPGYSGSIGTGNVGTSAGTSVSKVDPKENAAANASAGSNATRRAEGGLISKPQKTVRSRKGLAS
jgi:hypothetical protein